MDAEGKPWSLWLAEDNPDVIVDNYAHGGNSTVFNDYLLRSCILHQEYDAIIVEVPSLNRWFTPQLNDLTGIEYTDYLFDNSEIEQITSNYRNIDYRLVLNQKRLTPNNPGESVMGLGNEFYSSIAIHSIESIYSLAHENIFWFFWSPPDPEIEEWLPQGKYGNIGHELPTFEFFVEQYQEDFFKVMTRYYDDNDTHFSPNGNKIMYYDYIKTSQIGNWLEKIKRGNTND